MQFGDQATTSMDYRIAAHAAVDERTTFIQRTYTHLSAAIVAFCVLEGILLTIFPPETVLNALGRLGSMGYLIVFGLFVAGSYAADHWASSPRSSRAMQYLGLSLYVVAQAAIFLPLMAYSLIIDNTGSIPLNAGIITGIVFVGLTAMVFVTKADFSWMGKILWLGGLAAMAIIVVSMVMGGGGLGLWFSAGMVVLAAGYILYYTSNVMHHYHTDQYVAASLALFASVTLLLYYVMRLLMSLRE